MTDTMIDETKRLTLNGEPFETGAATLAELLRRLGIAPSGVAVELNLQIIKKDAYEGTRIGNGDSIEIVRFVGGGAHKD